MTEIEKKNIIQILTERIKSNFDVNDIILFGSYFKKTTDSDSDIDLVVILNERGIAVDYNEKLNRRKKVSHLLDDIRKRIPLDILVYTIDEWERLQQINSSFIKEINLNGISIA
ncbi:nucleotidyltransferase domain protein [bacterium BMS3Abin03]|nr:nucleotidyltransferase domain protein [bacterium BMS3Abin03]